MEETENPDDLVAQEQERRGMPRCKVEADATLLLLSTGSETPCRIVELSLGGCRLEMRQRIPLGVGAPVEANFKIQGIAFRLSGLTEWTAGKIVGLSFGPVSPRRRDDLMEVLCEVEAKNAAAAQEPGPGPAEKDPEPRPIASPAPILVPRPSSTEQPEAERQPVPAPAGAEHDRRGDRRCQVDTSAVIYLVKIGSKLAGQILDLSLGGCRIHTAERFPVGIYTRVETEFRLQGLPLRLGGVIQAIHGRNLVGIRFLDVSQRKREQIAELIDEIVEMRGVSARE
jgi:hypothetical protein